MVVPVHPWVELYYVNLVNIVRGVKGTTHKVYISFSFVSKLRVCSWECKKYYF